MTLRPRVAILNGVQHLRSRLITVRSVFIGLVFALGIVVLTPYNDFVVNNSFLIGSYFPPIIAIGMMGIVLLINGPLHKYKPTWALRPGELAVIMAMALVSCSIPSQGLLRQLMGFPVAAIYHAGQNPAYAPILRDMNLSPSLFAATQPNDPAVVDFYNRSPPGTPIPWVAWVRPIFMWGLFALFFIASMLALACLIRHQWTVNERLAFPIVQLQSLLIAPPKPGRALNDIFRAKGFWIALALVFITQSSAAMYRYFPANVPLIPFRYDLSTAFSDEPWNTLPGFLKANTIFFTLLGISYFTQTRASFSLWATAVGVALLRWKIDPTRSFLPEAAYVDQQLGAAFAFAGGVIYIGRHHWMMIARSLVGKTRPTDPVGLFVSYRTAAIVFLVCVVAMIAWLVVAGCQPWVAIVIVMMILLAHLVTARVVAETGLAFIRVKFDVNSALMTLPASALTPRDGFFYGIGHYGYMQAARESPLIYAMHGMNTIDNAADADQSKKRVVPLLSTTLGITFIACVIASLWCYYSYAVPIDAESSNSVLNIFGLQHWPQTFLVDFPSHIHRGFYPDRAYSVWTQIGIGIGITIALQVLTLRYAAWPLTPVGFLMSTSWYVQMAWFSIFIGWLCKVLILRFGGATLYTNLKPVFIGLIFGEAMATGFWLIVTLLLASAGEPFFVVRFLPQ